MTCRTKRKYTPEVKKTMVSLRLPDSTIEFLKLLAIKENTSVSALIKKALTSLINKASKGDK